MAFFVGFARQAIDAIITDMNTGKVIAIAFFVSLLTSVGVHLAFDRLLPPPQDVGHSVGESAGITIPNLAGTAPDEARKLLRKSGLLLIVTDRMESEEVAKGLILKQSPLEGSVVKEGTEVEVVVSKGVPAAVVPDLAGLNRDQAQQTLEAARLTAEISTEQSETIGRDLVISFEPKTGTILERGSAVTLKVSSGGPQAEVPRLIRARIEGAKRLIRKAGFTVGEVIFRDDPEAPGGSVLRQDPKPGTMTEKGSAINIWVNTFE